MSYFSQNVQILRKANGLKQVDILDFNRSTWSNYETGTSTPTVDDLIKIAKFFGVSVGELIETDMSKNVLLMSKAGGLKKIVKSPPNSPSISPPKDKKHQKSDTLSLVEEPPGNYHRIPQVITVDSQGNENVIMVPVKARAGYLNGYADPKFISKMPAYRLPGLNNGTFRLFEVDGSSMYPTLSGGDLVIGQNVEQLGLVRDDRVHVIVTKEDGVVVKRVLNRINKDGKLILKSDNYKDRDMYPPIVCNPEDVIEIWYAIGFISRQLRPPEEMYKRLIDLEGRFTLLEASWKKTQR